MLNLKCRSWMDFIEHKHSMSIGVDILFATEICIILSSCFAKQLYFSYILYYIVHTIYSIEVNIIMHQLALHIRTTSRYIQKKRTFCNLMLYQSKSCIVVSLCQSIKVLGSKLISHVQKHIQNIIWKDHNYNILQWNQNAYLVLSTGLKKR